MKKRIRQFEFIENSDVNVKELLRDIKEFIEIERECTTNDTEWSGEVSFNGIKRLIHGIWVKGRNEQNHNMVKQMPFEAADFYMGLIEKYKNHKPFKVNIY